MNLWMGGGGGGGVVKKALLLVFPPPVTSTNVGISPPSATLAQNVNTIATVSPELLNLNQDHPTKNVVFLVKSL